MLPSSAIAPELELPDEFQAFFSYARADAVLDPKLFEAFSNELAARVTGKLVNAKLSVWRDTHKIETGDQWNATIEQALKASQLLIVMLSPNWLKSDYCRKEFDVFMSVEPAPKTFCHSIACSRRRGRAAVSQFRSTGRARRVDGAPVQAGSRGRLSSEKPAANECARGRGGDACQRQDRRAAQARRRTHEDKRRRRGNNARSPRHLPHRFLRAGKAHRPRGGNQDHRRRLGGRRSLRREASANSHLCRDGRRGQDLACRRLGRAKTGRRLAGLRGGFRLVVLLSGSA
ncbi:MAG: toll/interleukin-1 receptor domain-containing protein [Methylocystis sp.]|nr:toll/interleukin-1 receptor domain-containing protein [Methylocystis sp.]